MDEQLRRYYLDQLGIQCWQSLPVVHDEVSGTEPVAAVHDEPSLTIEQAVQECAACPLHQGRKQALPGRGDTGCDVLVLLASPSAQDDMAGRICSGEQGELLDKMLAAIGLSTDEVYITCLLKCAVPAQHTIMPAEVEHCRKHLDAQLAAIRPGHVLMLGELTARCFFQQDSSLDAFREEINVHADAPGSVYGGAKLMVSYSPQELIQAPACKRKAWQDLQLLQARLAD